jgi:branched-chain amino acid transport system ATP-binding protein
MGLTMGLTALALETRGLVAGYEPDLPIVRGASIHVALGEIVLLLGPNGAGKSTLVKAIAGLVPVSAGEILADGASIAEVPTHRLIRRGLAFVPQTDNVFTGLSVRENLILAGGLLPANQRTQRVQEMLTLFPDLARLGAQAAGRLSGGQRQMLAIARALVVGPKLLMLDEPSAGLSPLLVGTVMAKLAEIRGQGVTILMVEQNARAALPIADRAYVLVEGHVTHEGAAAGLFDDPAVAALYLGGRPRAA